MLRPRKCHKVCCMPKATEFLLGSVEKIIILILGEYESICFIDKEGFS